MPHDQGPRVAGTLPEDERRLVPEAPWHPVLVYAQAERWPHCRRAFAERIAKQNVQRDLLPLQLEGVWHVLRHAAAAGPEVGTDHSFIAAGSTTARRRRRSVARPRHSACGGRC